MARRHFAKGVVAKPNVPFDFWMDELRNNGESVIPANQANRIAKTVLRKADPKQYLLSHATIVASVDAYAPKNVKLGKQFNRGVQIDVRYPEFRLKPDTHRLVNNNCFPAGVMILMADGTERPIEDIKVGDEVISHTGNIRKVVRTFKNPHNGPVFTIRRRGDSRKITMTGEHPVHAMRPKRHGAKTIFDESKSFEWISAGLLQKYDLLYTPKSLNITASSITPGKAKLIGYFLAEGYYYKQSPSRVSQSFRDAFPGESSIPCSVVFSLNKDETDTLASDIVRLLKQEFGVEALISPHLTSENAITVTSTRSLELVKFFLKHVGQKAKEKQLSRECMQLDPELQKLILQGWIEGDGTVKATLTGWVSSTTSSWALASQMVVLFNRCGVPTSRFMKITKGRKRIKSADGNWSIANDDTKSCISHTITVNSIDSTRLMSGSWLEAIHKSASARLKKHNFLKFRVQPDKMIHQVLDVKKESFSGLVYNFETEVDHSYVANGVAVHNCDAWDRPLLLSSYRTFVGAANYVEHIQLPELSKGFIVDSIARDLGHSVYVDILVATDKKHEQLVQDIMTGRLNSLSMGCTSQFTICTKCGNVAYDDASLCPCITVDGKGSTFLDEDGIEHSVAELIGHVSVPNSNVFIEASWVHTPAFTGAVRRNVLNEDEDKLVAMMQAASDTKKIKPVDGVRRKATDIFRISAESKDPKPESDTVEPASPEPEAPAADTSSKDKEDPLDALQDFLKPEGDPGTQEPSVAGPESEEPAADETEKAESEEESGSGDSKGGKPDKLDKVVGKIEDSIIDAVIKKIEDRFNPKPEDVGSVMITPPTTVDTGNDNLVTATLVAKAILNDDLFASDLKSIADRVLTGSQRMASGNYRLKDVSHRDMLILLWAIDKRKGREYPTSLYKVAMKLGSMANYPSKNAFLATAKLHLGRALTPIDVAFFIEKAELTSIAGF